MTYKQEQLKLLTGYVREEYSLSDILSKNFDPATQDASGFNLLHLAITHNRKEDVETILESELTNINKPTDRLNSPLHIACKAGNLYLINLLLKHKAKPNLQNEYGDTPFFLLQVADKSFLNADYIIKHNIDLNIYNKHGLTLFNSLIQRGFHQTINSILSDKKLCNEIEWTTTDNNNNGLITSLIQSYNETQVDNIQYYNDTIKQLIKYGCSVNHKNIEGNKPLINAVRNHNPEMVELLYKYKADFSSVNSEKESLGVHLNDLTIETHNEAMTSSANSDISRVLSRLSKLNSINNFLQKENLYTPSINEIKKILLSDIKLKDLNNIKESYTKHVAESKDKQEILDYCLLECLNFRHPKIQIANFFIKQGANINSKLIHTNTAAHNYQNLAPFLQAIEIGTPDSFRMVEYMLKNNYDPSNDVGDNNYNALHYLVNTSLNNSNRVVQKSIMQQLLKTNTNINQQSMWGETPLHFLLKKPKSADNLHLIEMIINKKPLVNIANEKGLTVYDSCVNTLNEIKELKNAKQNTSKQEILASIEVLKLEQAILQTKTSKIVKVKI